MSTGAKMIRITLHRAFDRHGSRLRGQFAAILGKQQLCISSNPFQAAAGVLISAGYDPDLPIAGRPAEADFDALTWTIGEAAKWTIEKNGTVSPLSKAPGVAMTILQSKILPDDRNGGDVDAAKGNSGRFADKKIAALQEALRLGAVFISSRAAR
jgi:hypothetical protein